MTRLPHVTVELVVSAYEATGLRPARLVWRQGRAARATAALLEVWGGAGEGGVVAPPDLRAWWSGFEAGWDFAPDIQVQSPLSQDGLFRLGRATGSLIASAIFDTSRQSA